MHRVKNYTPLRIQSHYSLLEGLSRPDQIAARCSSLEIGSCAITDNGTISGAVEFYRAMKSKNIKPIIGCKIFLSEDDAKIKTKENSSLTHILLLSKNYAGWKSLVKIISASNDPEVFYNKPRLDLSKLEALLDGNIIGLCGHQDSIIWNKTERNTEHSDKNSCEFISHMKSMFGIDNFFLESQLMNSEYNPDQIEITNYIRHLGEITKTKVVCTPDAYYCNSEDCVDQRILLCNKLKTTMANINQKILNNEDIVPSHIFFKSNNFYILSPKEMDAIHNKEEIDNTNVISDMCDNYSILNNPVIPHFTCPNNSSPDEYLRELCRIGWKDKIVEAIPKDKHPEYVERIKYELEVLQGAGLSSYFLIVRDIVDYVRRMDWLPGPGRGSASGCLASYLIGITSIDPIKYNLIFERFYNSGRNTSNHISMPDIDVDVPINKREDIINYIRDKYGKDNVSQMITFNTLKGRGALKEVLRVHDNISFEEMNRITKFIPDEAKIADELQEMKDDTGESSIIRWALENNVDNLKEWCYISEDGSLAGRLAKRFEQAIRIEGTKSNQSKHAAGVIISSSKLKSICPMIYDTKNKQTIAGMEMKDLEGLGIIKFDILGVALLDKIMAISDMIKNGE